MNQDDFKKILNEALEPIKETQKEHGQKLETLQSSLEIVQSSVVTIENTINAYGDMYKINDTNARKLAKRVETLEENAGLIPPSEFTLAKVQ